MRTAAPEISSDAGTRRASRLDGLVSFVPIFAVSIIAVIALMALAADLITPYSPTATALTARLLPPLSSGHLFGTDSLGRDILSRVIHGSRVSMSVVLVSLLVGGGVGTVLGILSGYHGRWIDAFIMRLGDIMLGFPIIISALSLAAVFG